MRRKLSSRLVALSVVCLLIPSCTTPTLQTASAEEAVVVLDTNSFWRCHMTWRPGLVRTEEGKLEPLDLSWGKVIKAKEIYTPPPPPDWVKPDFDDSSWMRTPGPVLGSRQHRSLAVLCLRGKFKVTDPSKLQEMTLSLSYRGGAVVYLNGIELVRSHLPEGKITPGTLAEDYPLDAYLDPDGYVLRHGFGDPEKYAHRFQQRIRQTSGFKVPAPLLTKGVNVLAVELHTAPAHTVLLKGKIRKPADWTRGYCWWSMLGFEGLKLTARQLKGAVVANVSRPEGLLIRTANAAAALYDQDYGEPNEPLAPLRLVGVRNGTFSGMLLLSSTKPVAALACKVSSLKSKHHGISSSAVEIRYGLPDGTPESGAEKRYPRKPMRFDGLDRNPPDRLEPGENGDGITLPIWVGVRVPREAKAGDYQGKVTIRAKGFKPVDIPVELKVHDWALPDPKEFVTHVGLVQSPESLALKYNMPMWSDGHWKLIDESFQLLGQVGTKCIFIPLIRRTHFGNEHSMVRWIKTSDGNYKHDFSIVERYLDLAVKHLGKVPVVCLYAWELRLGSRYFGTKHMKELKGIPFTILDPASGELTEAEGPKFGTPQVRQFYKPVFEGIGNILAKRGMEKSLMVGTAGDSRPLKEIVEDFRAIAPEVPWVVHSHGTASELHGQPVGYLADVWSAPQAPLPRTKRLYGWQNPALRTTFPRAGSNTVGAIRLGGPAAQYRLAIEGAEAAGIHGIGRVGADFWPVIKDRRGRDHDILGRFPESSWAQLNLRNSFAYVLSPGKRGPLPTIRFEMIRAGVQEAEARIFIEKTLTDEKLRRRLPEDLAKQCQGLLDGRTREIIIAKTDSDASWLWYARGCLIERSERLFAAAAEVARALAHK